MSHRHRSAVAVGLAAFLAASAAGAENRLAVLDVMEGEGISVLLSDALKGLASKARPADLKVMTRADLAEMLEPADLVCTADECLATIGRKLQATYVLGGALRRPSPEMMSLTIEAYRTADKAMLGSQILNESTVTALAERLQSTSFVEIVRGWLRAEGVTLTTESETVRIAFDSTPPGATVLVGMEEVCRPTPCSADLPVGANQVAFALADHATVQTALTVGLQMASRGLSVRLEPRYARVMVESEPPGVLVSLDDTPPRPTPTEVRTRAGPHTVAVRDPCHGEVVEKFLVNPGATRTIVLKPEPRMAAADVVVEDPHGNVLDAKLSVDGVEVRGPRFKVPLCSRLLEARVGAENLRHPLKLQEKALTPVKLVAGTGLLLARQDLGSVSSVPIRYETRAEWIRRSPSPVYAAGSTPLPWARIAWVGGVLGMVAGGVYASQAFDASQDVGVRDLQLVVGMGSFLASATVTALGVELDEPLHLDAP